jgi:hypothetical protein
VLRGDYCSAVWVELRSVDITKILPAHVQTPFPITDGLAKSVKVSIHYLELLSLVLPKIHIEVDSITVSAGFQMWPSEAPQPRQPQLSRSHRFQIASIDRQLGRGTAGSQSWLARVLRWTLPCLLLPLIRRISISVRKVQVSLHCPQDHQQQQQQLLPPLTHQANDSTCSLAMYLETVKLIGSCSLIRPESQFEKTSVQTARCPSPQSADMVSRLAIQGLSVQCSAKTSTHIVQEEVSYVLRRWGGAATLELTNEANSGASTSQLCRLHMDLTPNAVVAHADVAVLRTLSCFASAVGTWRAYVRYRSWRPSEPVLQNVRLWWRHAGRCVLMHVREVKQDARLPISCLTKLPEMIALYKSHRSCTRAGV